MPQLDKIIYDYEANTGKMVADVERANTALRGSGTSADKASKAIIKYVAGIGAATAAYKGLSAVISTTTDFNKSISDLSAITGATGNDLAFLTQKSLEFGATTTLSASQAADAFKLIASAKPDLLSNADALAQVTKEAVTLSEAAGINLTQSASAIGNALNQFNAGAEEASRFINVLAAGSKFGASSIEEINAAMVNVGGTAHTVGLSFEETNAALQVMAASGIRSAEAGTGLRSVLLNLENQNNAKFKPSVVGVSQAFLNLNEANLSTQEQMKLFGKLMFNQGNTLVQNADKLQSLTEQLTGTSTAYDQASTRINNLDGDVKSLNSALEAQAIIAGEKLDASLRVLVKGFTQVVSGVQDTHQNIQTIQKDAEDMAILMGQVADVIGNAFNGVVLAIKLVGDSIAGEFAAITLILHGDFKGAVVAAKAAVKDMGDEVDKTVAKSSRFEDIAKAMKKANEDARKAAETTGVPAAPSAPTSATTAAEVLPVTASVDPTAVQKQIDDLKNKAVAGFGSMADQTTEKYLAMWQKLEALGTAGKAKQQELEIAYGEWVDQYTADQNAKVVDLHTKKFEAIAAAEIAANMTSDERAIAERDKKLAALEDEKTFLMDHDAWNLERQQAYEEAKASIVAQGEAMVAGITRKYLIDMEKFEQASALGRIGIVSNMFAQMTASASTQSRALFEVNKAAATASAIVNGIEGTVAAWRTGNEIGGPVLGAVFAATAAATAAANVQKIQSTQFGGGGSATPATGGAASGGAGGGNIPSQATFTGMPQQQQQQQPTQVNITVTALDPASVSAADMQRIGDALAPVINESFQNGTQNTVVV